MQCINSNQSIEYDYLYFLAPDNGISSLISDHASGLKIPDYVSRTFHGRDIFAPIAAHLSKGLAIESLGTAISSENISTRSYIFSYNGYRLPPE